MSRFPSSPLTKTTTVRQACWHCSRVLAEVSGNHRRATKEFYYQDYDSGMGFTVKVHSECAAALRGEKLDTKFAVDDPGGGCLV